LKSLTLLLFAASAWAQLPVSVGLKAGYVNNSAPNREIVPFKGGPYLELSLPFLPTIETGILFERYQVSGAGGNMVYQVPVLIKKRINAVAIKPFFAGGLTFRNIPSLNASNPGLTVAGGVTLGLLPIKIEPEIRYTRWTSSDFLPRIQQTEFLIGIRF
jgi:hypothetical protein